MPNLPQQRQQRQILKAHLHPLKKKIKKQIPLRNNFHQTTKHKFEDDEDYIEIYDSIYVGYRRPELSKPKTLVDDDDISDYVKMRLKIARLLAIAKAREIRET
jgi:hypothetical protein